MDIKIFIPPIGSRCISDFANGNPWIVCKFEDFLFYWCPECNFKTSEKSVFIKHAIIAHPLSQSFIESLIISVPLKVSDDNNGLTPDPDVSTNTESMTDEFVGFRSEELFGHETKLDEHSNMLENTHI